MSRIMQAIIISITLFFAISVNAGGAEDAIAAAKAAQKAAAKVGGEWRDVRKMIKKAEKLLAEGKPEKAIEQARQAEAHGKLGHIQATTQDKLHI